MQTQAYRVVIPLPFVLWCLISSYIEGTICYMSIILSNVVLASLRETEDESETPTLGVTHVLNVAREINIDRSDQYVYKQLGISDDDPQDDIRHILDDCVAFIQEGTKDGGVVLVHCWSGVSRSACVVMAYLVRHGGLSAVDAFHKVLARRPAVDPWPRYLCQFQEWARELHA